MPHRPADNRLPPKPNGALVHGIIAWLVLVAALIGWGLWAWVAK